MRRGRRKRRRGGSRKKMVAAAGCTRTDETRRQDACAQHPKLLFLYDGAWLGVAQQRMAAEGEGEGEGEGEADGRKTYYTETKAEGNQHDEVFCGAG